MDRIVRLKKQYHMTKQNIEQDNELRVRSQIILSLMFRNAETFFPVWRISSNMLDNKGIELPIISISYRLEMVGAWDYTCDFSSHCMTLWMAWVEEWERCIFQYTSLEYDI